METAVKDILIWALPAFILAIAMVVFVAYRSMSLARLREYERDSYRQTIELKIKDLSQQLLISRERFESVNHLLLEAQKASREAEIDRREGEGFFKKLGVDTSEKRDENLIFVLMPFNNEFDLVYESIKKVVEEAGFLCKRGDEDLRPTAILPYILQEIVKARLVIADITGRNSNVFYELGMAHAMDKPVLMMAESGSEIPFDVSSTRVLIYEDPAKLREKLRKWLVKSLATSAT